MARRGSSFGMVMLVVVMAIVLLLVARGWREVAPTAVELNDETPALPAEVGRELPGLGEMRQATGEHVEQLEALAGSD